MSDLSHDREILKPLAQRYAELCGKPVMVTRRDQWRRLLSLQPEQPLIHVRGGRLWREYPEIRQRHCRMPFLQQCESWLRTALVKGTLDDDSVFEPWLTVPAVFSQRGWGVRIERHFAGAGDAGAWKHDPPISDLDDISALRPPAHRIDEHATQHRADLLHSCVDGVLAVAIDRTPSCRAFSGDISTDLGYLRGIEQVMLDMYDNPEGLHRLCRFMADGIRATHEAAEHAGHWTALSHTTQSMTYCSELAPPTASTLPLPRTKLWWYMAAQEFTLISPAMHDTFLLQYQLPILAEFGLVEYGCCEDLGEKIDMLRQIPNLRMVAVAPAADPARCAEQIGTDYVLSYRPSPAEMVCCGFDERRIRQTIRHAMETFKGLHWEINLKDVDTVEHDTSRLARWVAIVRDELGT